MKNKKEVIDRLKELQTHAGECWGFTWKNEDGREFAAENADSFEESFHYFKGDVFCLWNIETFRTADEIESITPYLDDSEEDEEDWSCDFYFVFRGGKELLVSSYTAGGSLGFLLEVKEKKLQTQDIEEIKKYFVENR